MSIPSLFFFFFNDTATTEIYTLSLHDALPIYRRHRLGRRNRRRPRARRRPLQAVRRSRIHAAEQRDRKSTRLNSSHVEISYAVFCLKKKKKKIVIEIDAEHMEVTDPLDNNSEV